MKCRLAFAVTALLLLSCTGMFAQQDNQESSSDVAFWVAFWSHPRVALFGPEHAAFNSNMQEILFPYDDHTEPSNPSALDDDARWLKEHANDRFYINGYASSKGRVDLQPGALTAAGELCQARIGEQGRSGKPDRVGGRMGRVISSLSGKERRMLETESASTAVLLTKLTIPAAGREFGCACGGVRSRGTNVGFQAERL